MKDILSAEAYWPSEGDPEKARRGRLVLAATFVIPAVLVIGILFLVITLEGGIQTAAADLALLLPLGTAYAAGVVASVNPCGIMMLTSYAFYQVRSEGIGSSAARRALWGLVVAIVVTLGFLAILAVVGIIIGTGGQLLIRVFPYVGLLLGTAMIGLGVWLLLTHRTLGIVLGKRLSVAPSRNLGNAFVFGLVYAVASLSCTLPIFLAVVGTSLASGGFVQGLGQFVGYALGMGTSIFVVIIGSALFRRAMGRWLRTLTPYIHRTSAMFLIGAGVYVIYYWLYLGGFIL